MNMPCESCVLIAICRRKLFKHLINQCSTLKLYLYERMEPPLGYYTSFPRRNHPYLYKRHLEILQILRPLEWYVWNRVDSNHDESTIIVASEVGLNWEAEFAGTVQHNISAVHAQLKNWREYETMRAMSSTSNVQK